MHFGVGRQDGFSLKYDFSLGRSSYSISVSVYFSKKKDADGSASGCQRILPRRIDSFSTGFRIRRHRSRDFWRITVGKKQ